MKHKSKVTRHLANFRHTKFVVIESLGPGEVSTGRILADYVSSLDSFAYEQIPLEIHNCPNAQSLRDVLANLMLEASEHGDSPILHFECHGSANGDGLVLANDEKMPWTELAPILGNLNLLTNFNLLVFLAACNAFYFIEEMSAIRPSPVYAVVAPSDELSPAEVMSGTRIYYRTLFESGDAGIALRKLKAEKLGVGNWFGKTAEEWFEEVVVKYVTSHCSTKDIAERARCLYQTWDSMQPRKSVGALKRGLRREHNEFVQKYFEKFFLTAKIPANQGRFEALRKRVDMKVSSILSGDAFRR